VAKQSWILGERAHAARVGLTCLGLVVGCNNAPPVDNELLPAPATAAGTGASPGAAGRSSVTPATTAGSAASPATPGTAVAGNTAAGAAGRPAPAGAAGQTASAGAASVAGSGGPASAGTGGSAALAGSGGAQSAAGSSAVAGTSGAAGSAAERVKPPCLKKSSQFIALGDSYVNWITHSFPDDFKKEFGEYRMYAVGGASMASGGISGFIPDQLTMAIREDKDIIAGVMTGGGNDILIADTIMYPGSDACKDRTDSATMKVCQDVVKNALDTAGKMMKSAADAGIKDVIYMYYPHIPGGGFGGMNPNVILDYSLPMARAVCEGAEAATSGKMRCHFLDLQPVFEGQTGWFADDGIHENSMGSAVMAKEVVKILKAECIAQPEASGCCTP